MVKGEAILNKIKKLYENPYSDLDPYFDWREYGSEVFPYARLMPGGDDWCKVNLNRSDYPIVELIAEQKDDIVEVYLEEVDVPLVSRNIDESLKQMLCDKYGFINTERYENSFYTVIDSIDEKDIKAKIGQMLTASLFIFYMDLYIPSFNDIMEGREEIDITTRYYGRASLLSVRDYLMKHDWIMTVEDCEQGFYAETVFADSNGQPLKIFVYQSGEFVRLACDHNYKELSTLEKVDDILGYLYCERCEHLAGGRFEFEIEDDENFHKLPCFVIAMLIAEHVPEFKECLSVYRDKLAKK